MLEINNIKLKIQIVTIFNHYFVRYRRFMCSAIVDVLADSSGFTDDTGLQSLHWLTSYPVWVGLPHALHKERAEMLDFFTPFEERHSSYVSSSYVSSSYVSSSYVSGITF